MSATYEAPPYAIFSSLPIQIFSLAPCSETP